MELSDKELAFLRDAETAEAEYDAELVRLFGKRAGDVRYTPEGEGEPGSKLRKLNDTYLAAKQRLRMFRSK